MHPDCLAEVAQALGRKPTKADLSKIEGALSGAMRELARTDAAWGGMSHAERVQAAAERAAADVLADAEKLAQRRASNLLAQTRESARLEQRAAALKARGKKDAAHRALFERFLTVDAYAAGVRNEALSGLVDAIEAVHPRFLGLIHDAAAVKSFARAVMDKVYDSPEMAKAAKAYTNTIEILRLRQNAAGADIGQLDYGYLPQPHDTGAVARAGAEQYAADVLPWLKRDRYVREDGRLMDDAEVTAVITAAHETLSTEGRNKMTPGQRRGGSRAGRFDDAHRAIHFKDADAYLAYLAKYGRGSMMDAILGHVGQAAKNIALMEELGANPNATVGLLKDMAEKADNKAGARRSGATVDMVWDTLNGSTAQPVDPKLAQFFQGVRNFTTAVKLQGVMLSAVTDAPLQVLVAKTAGMPLGDAVHSLFAGVGGDKKRLAHELAIGVDEVAGEMARWHQDHLAQGWTSKLANTTIKLTLVEAWTNALRRGFAVKLSGALERQRHTAWGALDEASRRRFAAAGITEADWAIWQRAEAHTDGKAKLLTKDGIAALEDVPPADRNRAIARLLGFIDSEAKTAVLAPDLLTRAGITQGTRAGTWGGEMLRSLMLFKSFAFAIVDKHLRRLDAIPSTQGKVAYSAAMMTSLTLFGAASMTLKDLAAGKDPRDPTKAKFWTAAFLQGGGVGIFGDVLYTGMGGNARGGQANWTSLAGPVAGTAMDFLDVTLGSAARIAKAEPGDRGDAVDKAGDSAFRFARGNLPIANLWYLRGAVDHVLLNDMQEQINPGYLRRMKQRAKKDWGQDFWWQPGEALPDRAPDVASDGR